MARSSWKMPYINGLVFAKLLQKQVLVDKIATIEASNKDFINNTSIDSALPQKLIIEDRASVITKSMLGLYVYVNGGNRYVSFKVTPQHLGKKYGEFAHTRRITTHKEEKKKLKK